VLFYNVIYLYVTVDITLLCTAFRTEDVHDRVKFDVNITKLKV